MRSRFVALGLLAVAGVALADQARFERFGSSEGFPVRAITSLEVDGTGFLWVGSRDGLYVYDGYAFRSFVHDPGDAGSLSDNGIRSIASDEDGAVWIGTNTAGVARLSPGTDRFTAFRRDPVRPGALSGDRIAAVLADSRGGVWVGTEGGLDRIDRASGTVEHAPLPADPASAHVNALFEDREGRIWVGTGEGGIYRSAPGGSGFASSGSIAGVAVPGMGTAVCDFAQDAAGRIWIGSLNGLYRADPATGRIADVPLVATLSSQPVRVVAVVVGEDGRVWVGTDGLGVLEIDPGVERVSVHNEDDGKSGSLSISRVMSLAMDRTGSLWIGTWGGGLYRLDPSGALFTTLGGEADSLGSSAGAGHPRRDAGPGGREAARTGSPGGSLASVYVTALLEQASGELLIGTTAGLDRRDATGLRVDHVAPTIAPAPGAFAEHDAPTAAPGPRSKHTATPAPRGTRAASASATTAPAASPAPAAVTGFRNVIAIADDPRGAVWLGTTFALFHASRDLRTMRRFVHDSADPRSLGDGFVSAVLVDRSGGLWAGTTRGGVSHLAADGRSFDRFVRDPDDPSTLGDNAVTALLQARDGAIWVGTRSGGLSRLDPATGRCARFTPVAGHPSSLSYTYVTCLRESRDGTIWVGTGGGGLDRMVVSGDGAITFRRFTEKDGLPDNNVMSIEEDDDGTLWLATRSAMARFDPARGAVVTYRVPRNLPWAEFNAGAAAAGAHHLHFGSLQGVVSVRRGTPFPPVAHSPTLLTSLSRPASPIGTGGAAAAPEKEQPPWSLERLSLPYGQQLTLEYTVLDLRGDEGHRYEYRLGGSDAPWIDIGRQRQILFTDLRPGAHVVRVRGRNSDGVWSEARPLQVDVIPPFWLRTWFRATTLAAFGALLLAGHLTRTSRLARRNAQLVQMEKLRAEVLRASQEKERELERSSTRLRALARGLETAKEDERKRIARELHDEMGQGLTATKINLQILGRTALPERDRRRLGDAIDLVERMIGHVRALSLDLRPPLMDELGLLPAIQAYVAPSATRAGIEFDLATDDPLPRLPPELEIVVFRIVQELTTNTIRHAEARHLSIGIHIEQKWVRIDGRDDGRGFDLQEVMKRAGQGKHVGLLGMIERARGLGGEVEIETSVGRGACVRVRLPLEG